jgi:hypothetical protein
VNTPNESLQRLRKYLCICALHGVLPKCDIDKWGLTCVAL